MLQFPPVRYLPGRSCPGWRIQSCWFLHPRKGRTDVTPLLIVLTLLVTITVALALGVFLGYAAVNLMLRAMRRQTQPVPERTLATTHASSGD